MDKSTLKNFGDYHVNILKITDIKSYGRDQHFKQGTILENIKNIMNNNPEFNINTLLEPGCGESELSAFLCKTYDISNVYLFDFNSMTTSGIDIYTKQQLIFNSHNTNTKVILKMGDFFSKIPEVPDQSVDLIIDGCSVTHFSGGDSIYNSGITSWKKASDFFKTKIKKTGYVIISTDIKDHPDLNNIVGSVNEFVYPMDIINIFINNGFKIVFNPIVSNDRIIGAVAYDLRVLSICFQLNE